MMNAFVPYSQEERSAIAKFTSSPEQQEELRAFMLEVGAKFGQDLSNAVLAAFPTEMLLRNSTRNGAADICSAAIKAQERRLRLVGHDQTGIDIYVSAARAALDWLGV